MMNNGVRLGLNAVRYRMGLALFFVLWLCDLRNPFIFSYSELRLGWLGQGMTGTVVVVWEVPKALESCAALTRGRDSCLGQHFNTGRRSDIVGSFSVQGLSLKSLEIYSTSRSFF